MSGNEKQNSLHHSEIKDVWMAAIKTVSLQDTPVPN
jgi:hypothetical protein